MTNNNNQDNELDGIGPEEVDKSVPENGDKADEYLNGWRRAQADYANLKKEMESAKIEVVKYANENLLLDLLPALDHYEKALENIPELPIADAETAKKFDNWLNGLKAVKMFWEQALKSAGMERIEAHGEFDAAKHDAVSKEKSETVESGNVVKVLESGWSLNGKVIRPAKVVVAE